MTPNVAFEQKELGIMQCFEKTVVDSEPDQRQNVAVTPTPRFTIGQGRRGGWIVNDRLGLVGGIFVSEAAARHFAFEESGGHQEQIFVAPLASRFDLSPAKVA